MVISEISKSFGSSLKDYREVLEKRFIELSSMCKYWNIEEFIKWFCLVDKREYEKCEKNMRYFFEIGSFFQNVQGEKQTKKKL